MARTGVLAVLVGLVVLAAAGGVTASLPEGGDSQLSLGELREGGQQVASESAPESVRLLGGPGSVLVQYLPARPFASEKEPLTSGSRLETNKIEILAAWYGDDPLPVTVHVAYWQEGTRTVTTENGTTAEPVATNVTHETTKAQLVYGYQTTKINLRPHYDEEYQVTMWLETGGEPIEGARWRFKHKSNPASSGIGAIDSQGDLWMWGAETFLFVGLPGIALSFAAGRRLLDRMVLGFDKGAAWWVTIAGIAMGVIAFGFYYQAAVILSNARWIAGGVLAVMTFVMFLEYGGADTERAEFNKKELTGTTDFFEEESKKTRNEHIKLVDIVRKDGKIYLPASGIRPALARVWADPAAVDESDLETVNDTEGDVAKKYEVDPGAEYEDDEDAEVLVNEPAHIEFGFPLFKEDPDVEPLFQSYLESMESHHPYVAMVMAIPFSLLNFVYGLYAIVNWRFVAVAAGGFAVVYGALGMYMGLTGLGFVFGLVPAAVAGASAVDGRAEFEPAPYHFSDARAVLAHERATYREATTWQEMQELVADVDMEGIETAQDMIEAFRNRMRTRFDNMLRPAGDGESGEAVGRTEVRADD